MFIKFQIPAKSCLMSAKLKNDEKRIMKDKLKWYKGDNNK